MVDLPGPVQDFSRWELIRDALVFQAKLFLDGLRDLLLVPVSLVALVVDLVTGGEHAGRNFYGVVLLGRRSESWIDLFAAGDRIEVLAIKNLFGPHADNLACSSTKSMTGHLLGAAGGVESAVAALAIHDDELPPTINQTTPDPECDIDCVANERRKMTVRAAMNNSFGFGGTNATILLTKHGD